MRRNQSYWGRVELLARTGAHEEPCQACKIAIGLAREDSIRRFLLQRQAALAL